MSLSAQQKLGAARLLAINKAPYLTSAIYFLIPREAPGLRHLVATSARGVMVFNPEMVAAESVEVLASALVHEVSHILREYWRRCAAGNFDPQLFNIAQDLTINGDLKAGDWAMGTGWLLPETFKLADGKVSEAYYADLLAMASSPTANSIGSGQCGGCAGNPTEDEAKNDDGPQHTEAELAVVRKNVANEIQSFAQGKGRGSVPGGWLRFAEMTLAPPRIRWEDKLARMLRRACTYRPGATVRRYSIPSRWQGVFGYGADAPIIPGHKSQVANVALLLDTSGSMSETEIGIALREAQGILKTAGASIEFCAIDSDVQALQRVDSVRDMARLLRGGGGTSFIPAFEALAKRRPPPSITIVATDGDGPAPAAAPPWTHTVWLLIGKHASAPCDWGDIVRAED